MKTLCQTLMKEISPLKDMFFPQYFSVLIHEDRAKDYLLNLPPDKLRHLRQLYLIPKRTKYQQESIAPPMRNFRS